MHAQQQKPNALPACKARLQSNQGQATVTHRASTRVLLSCSCDFSLALAAGLGLPLQHGGLKGTHGQLAALLS